VQGIVYVPVVRWQKPALLGGCFRHPSPLEPNLRTRPPYYHVKDKVSSAGHGRHLEVDNGSCQNRTLFTDDGDEAYVIPPIGLLEPQRFERSRCLRHRCPDLKLIFRWLFIRFGFLIESPPSPHMKSGILPVQRLLEDAAKPHTVISHSDDKYQRVRCSS